MTSSEVIKRLKNVDNVHEVYQVVASYEITRTSESGETQVVRIEMLDAGEDAEQSLRYHCHATANNGASATGNHAPSLHFALSGIQWQLLDLPE